MNSFLFSQKERKNISKHFFSLSAEEDEAQIGNCCSNTKVLDFTTFVLVWHPCINRNVVFFSALVPKISQSNMANSVDRIWRTLLLLWHQEWVTQYCFHFVSLMIQFTLYTTGSKLNSLRVVPYFRDAGVGRGGGSLAHLPLNFPENIKTFWQNGFLCLPILSPLSASQHFWSFSLLPNSGMGAAPKRLLAVAYITTCKSVKSPDQERVETSWDECITV